MLQAASDFLEQFYASLPDLPVTGPVLSEGQMEQIAAPPAEIGRNLDELLGLVGLANLPGAMHPAGGHMAYIPNGGLFAGAVGAFIASGLNRYTGVAPAAPGLTRLEMTVLDWLEELFELPAESAGSVLLSGGSMANFSALVAARTARLPDDFSAGTIYVTTHVHHSITKAAQLAGFATGRVRTVPVDDDLRMDTDALVGLIDSDNADGLRPFLVVGSAGSTDTGVIDPLSDVAAVACERGLWFHVDAAYGGFFQLTERGRKRLVGIGAADSITLDPHKGLSIPFGVGALLVRDRSCLFDANSGKGAYLQDDPGNELDGGAIDFSSLGPELTRPFRGLEVWLPLQLHGVAAFRAELDRILDLADYAYYRLCGVEGIARVWKPDLSIVAFQFPDDDRARHALEAANATGRVAISSTSIDGRYTLRLALLNRRTTRAHVDDAVDLIAANYGP